MSDVLDPDLYDINEVGDIVRVPHELVVERKKAHLEYEIKKHRPILQRLEEQLEQTTTIALVK